MRRFRSDPLAPEVLEQVRSDANAGGSSSGNLDAVSLVLKRDAQQRELRGPLARRHFLP